MAPVLFVFGTLFLLIVALFTFLFLTTKIPPVNPYIGTQASIVTYSDGTEIGRFASENRIEVDLKSIPLFVRRAVLAAEDQSFYEQPAFSLKSIARALVNNLSGGETQGGSTITQQYVKIAYLSQEKTLERKLRELIIAIKLEYNFDKNSIMESYLNTIYFGRGAYGIQTASNQYFGKSVSQLTVSQAIVLASVIRSPGLYDPRSQTENFSRLEGRFNLVKQVMFENSWISKSVFDEIEFPETNLIKALNTFGGVKGHIMEEGRKNKQAACAERARRRIWSADKTPETSSSAKTNAMASPAQTRPISAPAITKHMPASAKEKIQGMPSSGSWSWGQSGSMSASTRVRSKVRSKGWAEQASSSKGWAQQAAAVSTESTHTHTQSTSASQRPSSHADSDWSSEDGRGSADACLADSNAVHSWHPSQVTSWSHVPCALTRQSWSQTSAGPLHPRVP